MTLDEIRSLGMSTSPKNEASDTTSPTVEEGKRRENAKYNRISDTDIILVSQDHVTFRVPSYYLLAHR